MKELTDSEFEALISLLDDPDEEVLFHVSKRLTDIGLPLVDRLEKAWEHACDELTQNRIEDIIRDIQFGRLKEQMTLWIAGEGKDLLQGAMLVAGFRYPDLDQEVIERAVDDLTQRIWLELNNGLTPLEEVNVFNNVFFKITGFIGEQENFTNPELGFINKVLELKKGNAHALGILYLTICQRLKLPVYGIDLPYYFVLAYVSGVYRGSDIDAITKDDISFYINPVNDGTVFQAKQIAEYLKKMNIRAQRRHYLPISNIGVIKSLVYYLFLCYEQRSEHEKAIQMKELYELFLETEDYREEE